MAQVSAVRNFPQSLLYSRCNPHKRICIAWSSPVYSGTLDTLSRYVVVTTLFLIRTNKENVLYVKTILFLNHTYHYILSHYTSHHREKSRLFYFSLRKNI